jgi:hypothetical protein
MPNQVIYKIDRDWLQKESIERISRELSEREIMIAKNCIEEGLNFGIDIIFSTAIKQAIKQK